MHFYTHLLLLLQPSVQWLSIVNFNNDAKPPPKWILREFDVPWIRPRPGGLPHLEKFTWQNLTPAERVTRSGICAPSWNIFQHEKRNFVSPCGHVISSICMYYITTRTCTSLSSILLQIKMTNQFLLLQIHFGYLYVSSAKFRPFTFSFVVTEFYCIDLVITLNVFPRESWEG